LHATEGVTLAFFNCRKVLASIIRGIIFSLHEGMKR
jgi:hypothetical protein